LAFLLIYQLIKRNEKARRQLSYIMPLLVVLETINFYIGWHSTDDAETMSDIAVFSIGFIVIGIIAGGIVYVYNTPFMKEFFASPIDDKINTQIHDNLDE
jgi:hypothetical protein